MEELMNILEELRPDVDFETETGLIANGILDSFDIVTLVTELNDADSTYSNIDFNGYKLYVNGKEVSK